MLSYQKTSSTYSSSNGYFRRPTDADMIAVEIFMFRSLWTQNSKI